MYLTGRTSELDRIRSVIGASKESALSIVARRGAGKSALLSQIPRLSDYRTVFLQANAAEADWPFSGLTALLNGIDDPILSRFTDQLLRTSTADMNVSTVSTMLLDGLHKRSSGRTVIVVDDADQLDASTQAVLGFLSRRLAGTDIALFTSVREQGPGSPFHSIPALHLSALDYKDTVRMLESFPARQTATAAIHAVAAASQGNLAAAVELYTGLLERQAEGTWAFPIPLACRSSFDSEYATAVGSLGAAARQVLNLLSLSRRSDIATLEKVCGELWPGLDELLGNGLASQSGPHVRIPDQLLRGYVYSAMPPAARTAGHRTLAEAAGADDPYAQRWHQSFSAPERETPLGLLRFAVDLIRTGEVPFALEYIERALTVGPCGAESAVRLATAAELLFNRGEFVFARRYLEWAQRVTCNPALVLRLAGLGFELQFMQGTSVRPSMVLRLVKEFGQHDPAYSARLLAVGSLYYAERWELDDALTLLQHVQEFRDAASSDCLAMADCAARLVDAIRGKSVHLPRTREAAGTTLATVLVEGRALTYAEHHGAAHEAHAIVRSSGEAVDLNWRQTAAHFAVDNEIRAGNVRRAILLIDRLEHSDPETKYHRGMRHIFRVWRAHSLGDEALAQRFFAEAQHFVSEASHPAVTAQLAACQGQFALMRGDLAEAFAQLSRAAEIGTVFANPTLLRSEADLVEVLIRLGRHSEAIRVFGRLESRSIGRRSSWLMTATARSRAMLSDGEESLRLFNAALESSGSQESLLERARTLLCYAERLSAFGRLGEGREGLLQAKVLFDECGADAWTQRVDSLLLDERIRPAGVPANPAMLMLTDHERSLAQMVARGMRNKEIAGTLFVSVRTVEVRLTSIYRKLGVESRAQLSALASGKMAATREPYVLPLL
ncbi:LuxR family transcriptional regulator [Pseudarthrobacter sp. BIM B-2242]|uniref:helix-turn-helix transcriptional regulator n=1 Tax=Pseudarthrobacter sp. BIM B-2242 TaxID=2772401 RepID=UPI00168A60FA|nr:LuxR family transcriptional regulator [Pseudarthrobacter sp. BIM B-2242]QOD03522.1 AAA family ATPase [Pseudarthrobacter sp. BIM B-2242]